MKNFEVEGRENLYPTNLMIVEKVDRLEEKYFKRRVVCDNSKVISEKNVLKVFADVYYC